jgi:hypothetical protein
MEASTSPVRLVWACLYAVAKAKAQQALLFSFVRLCHRQKFRWLGLPSGPLIFGEGGPVV